MKGSSKRLCSNTIVMATLLEVCGVTAVPAWGLEGANLLEPEMVRPVQDMMPVGAAATAPLVRESFSFILVAEGRSALVTQLLRGDPTWCGLDESCTAVTALDCELHGTS